MNNSNIWRFPGNNYTTDQGLNTGDMETFAGKPISSLAREICQNSIDARLDGKTAIVEFSGFDVEKNSIPGIQRLEQEIESCLDYRQNEKKIYEELLDMSYSLKNDYIHCLRVSDFNTKGLTGVNNTESSPFHLLTKGSGISDKNGSKGGSKGIGKYAAFVASNINTVFYSTYNIEGDRASIGISKLCSTRMENSDEHTVGIGYYGRDEKNNPILDEVKIDKDFVRTDTGTDVFIIGFRSTETWKKELITQILDSFMCAIYFEILEIKVDDIIINKSNLKDIVYNDNYIEKRNRNSVTSQYELLSGKDEGRHDVFFKDNVEIADCGKVKLYVKGYSKVESDKATNDCVMVRFPYMKIKSLTRVSTIPCSAMCIIEDDELNKLLRDIENPQHNNWFPDRIDDVDLKKETRYIISTLTDSIVKFISESLMKEIVVEVDVEGAGEYLPGIDSGENSLGGAESVITETAKIVKEVKNKVKDTFGDVDNEDGDSNVPDIGSLEDEGIGAELPSGNNNGGGGENHSGSDETGYNHDGDDEILAKSTLTGMYYRYFVIDKDSGKYGISFVSQYNEPNCELYVRYLDDANKPYQIDIVKATINGENIEVVNNKLEPFKIENGKRYKIELDTTLKDMYSWEVKLYARR